MIIQFYHLWRQRFKGYIYILTFSHQTVHTSLGLGMTLLQHLKMMSVLYIIYYTVDGGNCLWKEIYFRCVIF